MMPNASKAFTGSRRYLLDSHTFLWAVKNPLRLGWTAASIIEDTEAELFLSSISAYEVVYKQRVGKLDATYQNVVENYVHYAHRLGVKDLPLTLAHTYLAGSMEWQHKDPFDRFLVAQASLENLVIVTNDEMIRAHQWVETVW